MMDTLNEHLALCQELLQVVEREGQALRRSDKPSLFEFYQLKKNLLPRLNQSLDGLRKHRVTGKNSARMNARASPRSACCCARTRT